MESEDKRRIRDMEETIRMKNKQIHQLLEDVEEVLILMDQLEKRYWKIKFTSFEN